MRVTAAQAKKLGITLPGISGAGRTRSRGGSQREVPLVDQLPREASFVVPIRPRPKHRARTFAEESSLRHAFETARGSVEIFLKQVRMKTLSTKETRAFEKAVAQYASLALAKFPPFSVPVEVDVVFAYSGDPAGWPVAANIGDLDNLEKALFDALNGILYTDDRLVVRKATAKVFHNGQDEIRVTARTARHIA